MTDQVYELAAALAEKMVRAIDGPDAWGDLAADERQRLSRAAIGAVEQVFGAGLLAIAAERRRQVLSEGWTVEHDDRHVCGEMASAAAAYAAYAAGSEGGQGRVGGLGLELWPWAWSWWKPKSSGRDLERAGALIVAELERIARKAVGA